MMFTVQATILSKENVATETTAITFDVGSDFSFLAGEYITVTLPQLKALDLRQQFHDFSITSSPIELPKLTITYRNSESEFKKTLTNLALGDKVSINGPKGVFTLPKDTTLPIVFIAGGVGITPFVSMARFITTTNQPRDISVYYFNHNRESAPYISEFENLVPSIKLISVFGPLTSDIFEFDENTKSKIIWFIAGPLGMINTALAILKTRNINDINIKTEQFTGYA